MPNFGHSSSDSYLAATQPLSVSPTRLGTSRASGLVVAAALSLTITGGLLGTSTAAGAVTAAALNLSMLSNFGSSPSRAILEGRALARLAEYEVIVPGVPGSPAVMELDFTSWDGTTPFSLYTEPAGIGNGYGDIFNIGTNGPYTAGQVPNDLDVGGNYYLDIISSTVLQFISTTNGVVPNGSVTEYGIPGNPFLDVTLVETPGVEDIAEVTGLVSAATDGFVVDVPIWPGVRNVIFITANSTGELRSESKALTLYDIGKAVYALWGYDGIRDLRTIEIGRDRLVQWCNAAMQLIYSQAARLEYFNRERIEVTVPASGSVALPSNVQKIMGDARISGRYLRPLESKSQVTDFASLYGGTVPLAFLVESLRDAAADSLAMTLYLAPAPSGDTVVTLDVTKEPPRYDAVDLLNGAVLQIPHKWAETIFKPLVMKWAAGDGRMPKSARTAQIQEIDAQYATARQMLGLADIDPVNVKASKEVNKEAA